MEISLDPRQWKDKSQTLESFNNPVERCIHLKRAKRIDSRAMQEILFNIDCIVLSKGVADG